MPPWSHNTMLTYDPSADEYVIFFIGTAVADPSLWKPCIHDNSTSTLLGKFTESGPAAAGTAGAPAGDAVTVEADSAGLEFSGPGLASFHQSGIGVSVKSGRPVQPGQ